MTYNTKQKERIIAFFRDNADKSFTADELISEICDGGSGKSTVYRIIASLCEGGMLRKTQDGDNGKCSYQLIDCHSCHSHLHLKCRDCGKLVHLEGAVSRELERALRETQGFELDESTMIYGRCESCRKQANDSQGL